MADVVHSMRRSSICYEQLQMNRHLNETQRDLELQTIPQAMIAGSEREYAGNYSPSKT